MPEFNHLTQYGPLAVDLSLVPPGERVLAAVSGGADSMALLWALTMAGREVIAGHVNHGLRGEESDADEAFVHEHCARLNIPIVSQRVEVARKAEHASEAAARAARYACLLRMAQEHACPRVATGHTAEDSLETILLNWLRGAAVSGLRGIEPQRRLGPGVQLVRPLLDTAREQTRDACTFAGWTWREDSSNLEPRYRRNRVRHELLPVLANLMDAPDGAAKLARQTARAARILSADFECLDEVAGAQLQALTLRDECTAHKRLLVLDGLAFRGLHLALQRRVLRLAATHLCGEMRALGSELVEQARRQIADDRRRAVWQWQRDLWVEWTGSTAGNRVRLWLVL